MAGSPLKRALEHGVRLEDGRVIAFPYMPRVADLPKGWQHFSAAKKVEHLIGLDRCYEILSWPWAGPDPVRRSMQMQVMRVLLPICIKAVLDGSLDREAARERNRAAALEALALRRRTAYGDNRGRASTGNNWRKALPPLPLSHARARDPAFPERRAGATYGTMAGSPLKRARKQGVRLGGGSVIAFPYTPRVADLPKGWRHFSAGQKIEHLIGLDRCYEILSWGPITDLDPLRRSFQMQVMRVLLPIGIKAVLDGSLDRELARERDRHRILDELARKLGAATD